MNSYKSILIFGLLGFLLLAASCSKEGIQAAQTESPSADSSNIETLNVPDGFNYSTVRQVALDLTTLDNNDKKIGSVLIYVFGINTQGKTDQLHVGLSNAQARFKMDLQVANHFKKLMVRTVHNYKEKDNNLALQENITMNLIVD